MFRTTIKKCFIPLLAALALMLASQVSLYAADNNNSLIETVLQKKELKIGFSTFVPWAMKDKTGKFIGFEIDVATRLARDMGVTPKFVHTQWSGIIPALLTGKFDIIIGGMGIRPDRNLKVNFSIPYDYSGMSLVANKKLARGFSQLSDFNKKDVILAARLGSAGVTSAQKYLPNATLKRFNYESQAIQEVLNGRAHAFVSSAPTPAYLADEHADRLFLPFTETFTKEPIGFAIRKGDFDALNYFNNWIRVVRAEGWLQERKAYWFLGRKWADQIK